MNSQWHCQHCSKVVSERHQAVRCDSCDKWQHRGCDSGISKYQYQKMWKGFLELDFKCVVCRQDQRNVLESAVAESSQLSLAKEVTADAEPMRMEATCTTDQLETMDVEDESPVLPPVPLPAPLKESSIIDTSEMEKTVPAGPEFTLVPRGTSRGKDLLVEAPGYTYTIRKETESTRFWWCSVRGKENRCPASVSQRGDMFIRGVHNHTHPSDPSCLITKQLTRQVKDTAAGNVSRSAKAVVEEMIHGVDSTFKDNIPRPDHLIRKANRFRQAQRSHSKLNNKTAHPPSFYLLVQLLNQEAALVHTQQKLRVLRRFLKYKENVTYMLGQIFREWDKKSEGRGILTHKLLKKISCVDSV